jgi:hypothetical protein
MAALQPSARLVRAVTAERAELERHRAGLHAEAQELRAALERIEHRLIEIDERCELLERLAPAPPVAEPRERDERTLRGPAIREAAVRTLIAHERDTIHYREWFELLTRTGHEISGKDPLAVFLTQISRSPAVKRGTTAGVYELDRHAPQRLRNRIEGLQHELRGLPATGTAGLAKEIGRQERALEEASRLLTAAPEAG